MKNIIVEIQKYEDGTIGHIEFVKDTEREAISQFHTVMAAAAVSNLPRHSCTMLTEAGTPLRYESYEKIVEPEETTPEAEGE